MSKAVIEKLNIVLEAIERRLVQTIEKNNEHMGLFIESHQEHQAVLYFRDLFASRHAEQAQPAILRRDEAIAMVDRLIDYHAHENKNPWTMSTDLLAVKILKEIRDHLDRCYDIRSRD